MKKYDFLLFDADNTLLDFNKAEEIAIKSTVKVMGYDPTPEMCKAYSEINLSVWKALELGKIDKQSLKTRRFEIFVERFSLAVDPKEMANTYMSNLSKQGILKKDTKTVLSRLKDEYHVCIITNGIATIQKSRMKVSELDGLYKKVYISDEIGFEKPDKRFFDAVFEDIGITDLSKVLVIGDSLTSDIRGAVNAGVDSCFLNEKNGEFPSDPRPTYMIGDLMEIFNILNNN